VVNNILGEGAVGKNTFAYMNEPLFATKLGIYAVTAADITGEKKWIKIAQLMWANAIQGITEREGQLTHGVQRPLGGQNEGFFQARWTKYRPTCELRGHFNDCLPGWVSAYRMLTVDRMRNSGKIEIIE